MCLSKSSRHWLKFTWSIPVSELFLPPTLVVVPTPFQKLCSRCSSLGIAAAAAAATIACPQFCLNHEVIGHDYWSSVR